MTGNRRPEVQRFIDALAAAFEAAADVPLDGASREAMFRNRLFSALAMPGVTRTLAPLQLPVCSHIESACAGAQAASPEVAALAAAFQSLAHQVIWRVRPSGGPNASSTWADNHANAVIVGQGGAEERDDVAIGASLMAPHVRYPDHDHPPEELYMVLTQGRFQHGSDPWVEIGSGGTFHNPPAIRHAMASGDRPLLAIWTMVNR